MDRAETAEWLTKRGFKTTKSWLAKLATVGGGPMYRKFGRKPLYYPGDLEAWITSKLSRPQRSTSDYRALHEGQRAEAPPQMAEGEPAVADASSMPKIPNFLRRPPSRSSPER
jgi:hypothetical protein